jgi:Ca2+-binding EF-hand superfamily protein
MSLQRKQSTVIGGKNDDDHQQQQSSRPRTSTAEGQNNKQEQQQDNNNNNNQASGGKTRILSQKDNIRVTREEVDEAFNWLTSRCHNGRLTARHLKDQLFSIFEQSNTKTANKWTRKEFALLASDPEMTAEKLWNTVLPRDSTCAAYDTVAEAFCGGFDDDGDGLVDLTVMKKMWIEISKEYKSSSQPVPTDPNTCDIDPEVLKMFLQIADIDADGVVSLEDFREYCKKKKPPL